MSDNNDTCGCVCRWTKSRVPMDQVSCADEASLMCRRNNSRYTMKQQALYGIKRIV